MGNPMYSECGWRNCPHHPMGTANCNGACPHHGEVKVFMNVERPGQSEQPA